MFLRSMRLLGGMLWLLVSMPGPTFATGSELQDPFVLFHPRGGCASGIIEIELWSRDLEIWQPHPVHSRVLADTCQREEAGGLLNEFRTRCWQPPSPRKGRGRVNRGGGPWRVGFTLSELRDEGSCPSRPITFSFEPAAGIAFTSPPPDEAIRSPYATVDFEGKVEIEFESIFLLHESLISRSRDAIYRALKDELERIAEELGPGRVAFLGFGTRDANRLPPPKRSVPAPSEPSADSRVIRLALDDSLPSLRVSLNRIANGAMTADRVASFSAALAGSRALLRSSARIAAQRRVVVLIDGDASLPFGEAIGARPVERERIIAGIDGLHEDGVHVRLLVVSSHDPMPSNEFYDRVRSRFVGTPTQDAVAISESSDAVSAQIAALRFPRLIHLEAVDVLRGTPVEELRFAAGGEFRFRQRLEAGANPLRLVARLSDGRLIVQTFEPVFDASLLRERLLEIERARMRRIRARRGVVTLEIEPE